MLDFAFLAISLTFAAYQFVTYCRVRSRAMRSCR